MVSWWMTISLATLLSGDHAAPVGDDPKCTNEYVTTWETQFREKEEVECTNVLKTVPVMVSKLEPRKICEENTEEITKRSVQEVIVPFNEDIGLSCHTELEQVWKNSSVELVSKECKTVLKKIPFKVSSKRELKQVCDEIKNPFDNEENDLKIIKIPENDDDELGQGYPPKPIVLPCWSGTECPSDFITV